MNAGEKFVATSLIHQYGEAGFKSQNAFKQLMAGDRAALLHNLRNWGDETDGRGSRTAMAIDKRYENVADRVESYLNGAR